MRIVFVITDLFVRGAEIMLFNLLARIDRKNFEVYVISLMDGGPLQKQIEKLDILVFALGVKRGIPSPLVLWEIVKLIRKIQPDLINSWMYHANIASLLAAHLADRSIPVVWNMTSAINNFDKEKRLTRFVVYIGAKLSTSVRYIIYCAETGKHLHEIIGFCPDRARIIPNGFDCDKFKPRKNVGLNLRKRFGLHESTPLIGVVGRYNPMKDHYNFISAMAQTALHDLEPHALFVGDGMDNKNKVIVHAIKKLGMDKRIHLMGECENVQEVMCELDILCSSSYTEAFPMTIGEAMASGVPCAVTDVGDSAWLVSETGLVAPPRDPKALAEACASLLKMKREERENLGLLARKRIMEKFSLDIIVQQYERLYLKVLSET